MTAAVTGSELEWTPARITAPDDRRAMGAMRAGFLGREKVGWAMTHADSAACLDGQLTDTAYLRAAPGISNRAPEAEGLVCVAVPALKRNAVRHDKAVRSPLPRSQAAAGS